MSDSSSTHEPPPGLPEGIASGRLLFDAPSNTLVYTGLQHKGGAWVPVAFMRGVAEDEYTFVGDLLGAASSGDSVHIEEVLIDPWSHLICLAKVKKAGAKGPLTARTFLAAIDLVTRQASEWSDSETDGRIISGILGAASRSGEVMATVGFPERVAGGVRFHYFVTRVDWRARRFDALFKLERVFY